MARFVPSLRVFAPVDPALRRKRFRPGLEPCEARALMATFTVTSLGDAGAGRGNSGDLRYCLARADADGGRDTITFAVAGTIQLRDSLPAVNRGGVTLVGPGADQLTIRGGGDGHRFTILKVREGATAAISGLTFTDGVARQFAGAIFNGGLLTLRDVSFVANSAPQNGGAVFNRGGLTVDASTFVGNRSANSGGGIYTLDRVTITNSVFSGNSAASSGGAVESTFSALRVAGTTLNDNTAGIFGGAISVNGPRDLSTRGGVLTVSDSAFTGNRVGRPEGGGFGGAIASTDSSVTIRRTSFVENASGRSGGAVGINGGDVGVVAATFQDNSTDENGGGLAINGGISISKDNKTAGAAMTLRDSTFTGNRARANGGGIEATLATVSIRNTTISGNAAGGSGGGLALDTDDFYLATRGTVTLANTTITGNTAGRRGGGIANFDKLVATGTTITGNSAGDAGGGIFNGKDLSVASGAIRDNQPDNVAGAK